MALFPCKYTIFALTGRAAQKLGIEKMFDFYIRFAGFLLFIAGYFHPFYVSVTTVTYHDGRFEIILYTFPDDVAKAIEREYHYSVNWEEPGAKDRFYADMYLHRHLHLFSGNGELDYEYLGFTFENEKLLLLAETPPVEIPFHMKVINTWLTEIYPAQQNIVHVLIKDKKFTGILDKYHSSLEIVYDE